ncbi:hypothetical protein QBC34DRAFT_404762 [Podospora aff. communis PSN243]|uniref:Ribosomal protein L9 domain-containing protein n=1 Tax=Podospora aff. communis PSN243 TaxID=3040156 RepID=A0AAV9GPP7_9PEZI|nr:hypothetical protein QBC34DRAFT_404762 [Podospora aff. communis PSN243]
MALSSSSTCRACFRRLAQPFGMSATTQTTANAVSVLGQTRAKSTTMQAHDQGVIVRLLKDIPKFGREHAIFRVERGRMRNLWYPHKKAEYMTAQRFRELGLTKKDIGERDRSFSPLGDLALATEEAVSQPEPVVAAPVVKAVPLFDAEVFRDTVATAIPETLTFFRKPIPAPPPPPEARISPLIATQASAAALEAERAKIPISIYGSVSATDIVWRIKTLLANEPELASLKLEPQHITFLGLPEDSDRLKALGRCEVKISVDSLVPADKKTGKPLEPIFKMVEVLAEEEPPF